MKNIPLSLGLHATVDDEDYDNLSRFKWHAAKVGTQGCVRYVACRNMVGKNGLSFIKSMQSQIMGPYPPDKKLIDHENHCTLDNRRENLRFVTHAENSQNQLLHGDKKTSSYRGVSIHQGRFHAQLCFQRKVMSFGHWMTEEAAALAYNKARDKHHGDFGAGNKLDKTDAEIIANEIEACGLRNGQAKSRIVRFILNGEYPKNGFAPVPAAT